jgi:hypothetical protein
LEAGGVTVTVTKQVVVPVGIFTVVVDTEVRVDVFVDLTYTTVSGTRVVLASAVLTTYFGVEDGGTASKEKGSMEMLAPLGKTQLMVW